MSQEDIVQTASAALTEVPKNWMSASQVRSIIFEDPALIWLEYYGENYGLRPDDAPFDFLKFIGEKGR